VPRKPRIATAGYYPKQKITVKFLFLILMLSAFGYANDDKPGVKAIISNTKIVAGNIVKLRIRATGDRVVFPNIKIIEEIKVLSHEERVTNIHTYNLGKFKKERTILILTFAPQKDMTIPSYKVEIDGFFGFFKSIQSLFIIYYI